MMRIFDIHTHVFPDAIAARTVEMLGEKAGIEPVYDGARAGLIQQMRSAGIKAALNCPIATRPEQVSSINRWAAENNTAPVYSLGTVHPETEDKAGVLASVEANGLPGIKLHPEYQQFDLLDERMAPVWTLCEREGLMIMLHAGADIAFEPPYRSDPARIRQLIERYPELKLVAAHFGSWRMWEEVAEELCGTPVYLDTSFTLGIIEDEMFVDIIRRHGADRVVFGTDTPWRSQAEDVEHFLRLPLTKQERRLILSENAQRLVGI